jgi:hypothetical protein
MKPKATHRTFAKGKRVLVLLRGWNQFHRQVCRIQKGFHGICGAGKGKER